jgi:hypothetical protein
MSTTAPESPDRGKTFVLVLTLINTVLAALITALQVDASIRSDQSLRASQVYAVQASGELVRYGVQTDYDLNTLTILTTNTQESLMAQFSALQRQGANDQQGSDALTLRGLVAQARADRAKSLSVLMTNPAYAPPSGQVLPNMSAYLADQSASANALVKQQNDASDAYHRWNSKSDSYVTVLTVLAMAFFLLGVAQMVRPGLRLIFAFFAIGVMGIAVLWSLLLLVL